jgi:hypothetical protein
MLQVTTAGTRSAWALIPWRCAVRSDHQRRGLQTLRTGTQPMQLFLGLFGRRSPAAA